MGAGIAEVFARSGHPVVGVETDAAAVDRGRGLLAGSLARAVARSKISDDQRQAVLDRITFTTDLAGIGTAELVVEAVSEDLATKEAVFRRIGEVVGTDAVLATNTSSLSVTAIAAATHCPDRVVGLHFFNPAPIQPLVEIVHTVRTDPEVLADVDQLVRALGKSAVSCGDRAGFVVNALLVSYLNRAARIYERGWATRKEIDQAMVDAAGYPMGPLALLDLIGLDVTVAVCNRLFDETKDPLVAPTPLLSRLVAAGMLGRKSGRGFYCYGDAPDTELVGPAASSRAAELPDALVVPYLNAALTMVEQSYAVPDDIDTAMSLGCAMPKPFDALAQLGPGHVLSVQRRVFAESAQPGDRPALLLEQLAAAPDPVAALAQLRSRAPARNPRMALEARMTLKD
jgi:3-hydroxybutyryl-CoA dehydrogenase